MDRDRHQPETYDEELLEPEAIEHEGDSARLGRMEAELTFGFRALAGVECGVSVFGSARTPAGHPEYELARHTAGLLGEAGFTVITGGGPGIMEAANRGAREAGATSVGLSIDLPFEAGLNRYVDIPLEFHYFFTRKVMFVRYAGAFVVFPGGYGTFDEVFEALTLIQTRKIRHFPVILVGSDYWGGLVDWLRERALGEGKILPEDFSLLSVTDDPDEVVRLALPALEHRRRAA
ncbi:MAG: TIGR00730 family Rossman fold protein [Thermoleophilaceae bacterium]